MRVSGVFDDENSLQNDERAQRRKYGRDDSDQKHLTGREVERLIEAARGSRNEARDRCLLLLMFWHGLRVSEACGLKLDQVDIESRVLHVARLKILSFKSSIFCMDGLDFQGMGGLSF